LLVELWDNDDREPPMEEYPRYLGYSWDGDFHAESELAPLLDFDFLTYSELVDDRGGERRLNVVLPSGPITILFNAYDGIADILDQLPTVNVRLDNSSDDGPASDSLCVFFIADGVSETELKVSVSALAETLKSDFNSLEKTAQGSTTLA
jgi:hypothetical protein